MLYAVILAAGIGSRMGYTEMPKQYLNIGNEPVIIRTIKTFVNFNRFCSDGNKKVKFKKSMVLVPADWLDYTKKLLFNYFTLEEIEDIGIIAGGGTRNETLEIAMKFIEKNYGINSDDIVVTHDAVRPFVSEKLISENIEAAKKYGACSTAIPTTDTVVEVISQKEGELNISKIPDRGNLYNAQTPQSFNLLKLKDLYNKLSFKQKKSLTDGCRIFTELGEYVHIVKGDINNIKITYPMDLIVGEQIIIEQE